MHDKGCMVLILNEALQKKCDVFFPFLVSCQMMIYNRLMDHIGAYKKKAEMDSFSTLAGREGEKLVAE